MCLLACVNNNNLFEFNVCLVAKRTPIGQSMLHTCAYTATNTVEMKRAMRAGTLKSDRIFLEIILEEQTTTDKGHAM